MKEQGLLHVATQWASIGAMEYIEVLYLVQLQSPSKKTV